MLCPICGIKPSAREFGQQINWREHGIDKPTPYQRVLLHIWWLHCGTQLNFCWCDDVYWPERNNGDGWTVSQFEEHISEHGGLLLHIAECALAGSDVPMKGGK